MRQATLELHRLIPEWADPATFTTGREALVAYAVSEGIDENTIRSIADPKLIGFMYRQMNQANKVKAAKPVEKPPKVLKSRMAKNTAAGKKARGENKIANAIKSKDTRDKVAAISDLLHGGQ